MYSFFIFRIKSLYSRHIKKNPFVRLVAYSINVRFQAGGIGNIQTEIYRVLAWTGKINLFEPKRGLFEYRFPRGEINYTFMRPYFIYESLSVVFWSVKFSCQFVNNMHSLTLHLKIGTSLINIQKEENSLSNKFINFC